MKKLREFVKEADQFSVPITLTYHSQRQFKSLTSGFVSLAIIAFFAYVFVTQFVAMINRSQVRSKTEEFKQVQQPSIFLNESNFMFTLLVHRQLTKVSGIDLTTNPRYFDISVTTGVYQQGVPVKKAVIMEPCTRQHWAKLGAQTENFFQLYRMSASLCPSLDFSFQLEGKFTFTKFKDMEIKIRQCSGVAGVDCRTAAETNAFLAANGYQFTLGIVYMDTLVDPDKENPYSYYINDDFYWGFSPQQGMQVMYNVRTQTIDTDNALLPVEQINTIVSPVIEPAQIGFYAIVDPSQQNYVSVYMMLSSTGIRVTRSFYRFDELLAYVGGLFGLLALLIDLPLRAYNQMCNDIGLSHYLYDYAEDPMADSTISKIEPLIQQVKHDTEINHLKRRVAPTDGPISPSSSKQQFRSFKKFNFLKFVGIWFTKLFRKCLPSCKSQQLDPCIHSLQTIEKELDIRRIFQRVLILERGLKCLMPQHLYDLLPQFTRQNILHMEQVMAKFKHYKHIVHQKIEERDQALLEDLRKKVGNALREENPLSKKILSKVDQRVLKLCEKTSRTSADQVYEYSLQNLALNDAGKEIEDTLNRGVLGMGL